MSNVIRRKNINHSNYPVIRVSYENADASILDIFDSTKGYKGIKLEKAKDLSIRKEYKDILVGDINGVCFVDSDVCDTFIAIKFDYIDSKTANIVFDIGTLVNFSEEEYSKYKYFMMSIFSNETANRRYNIALHKLCDKVDNKLKKYSNRLTDFIYKKMNINYDNILFVNFPVKPF